MYTKIMIIGRKFALNVELYILKRVMPLMRYSQDLIEEIRTQNDIVEVIGDFMPLTRKGGSYFGLCPFHNENTPSFSVSADKQFYYCFGCGAAGNVYSFVMQTENCDFLEAVKILADRAGILLPEPEQSKEEKEEEKRRQILFDMHKAAGRYYYECLHENIGEKALYYLNGRGVLPNIQKKFGIGFAPDLRDSLYKHLLEKGYSVSDMLKSGLVIENKNSQGYHDRFFNRLMFPIIDVSGRIIGFGGRVMGSGEPKYLNSPETMIFNKSRNLYGLNFAKNTRRREIILVEGYMDMISIYQAGFHNVCASLGTAFNNDHTRVLKKYADDVILLYDSDTAGTNAALRAIPVLVDNGFNVKVLQVPDGKDPDEFIKHNGSMEFSKLLVNAVSHISFQIECKRKNYNLNNPEHKVKFTVEAAKILASLSSDIERDVYIKEVSDETGISESSIKKEISKLANIAQTNFVKEAEKKRKRIYNNQISNIPVKAKGVMEAQRELLAALSSNINVYNIVKNYIKPSQFVTDVYCKAASIIYDINEKGGRVFPAEIVNHFESVEEQKLITEIFAVTFNYEKESELEKALNENIKLIKRTLLDQKTASVDNVEDIKKIVEEKINIDKLYIKITNG